MFRSATLSAAALAFVLSAGAPAWAQAPAIDADGAAAIRAALSQGIRQTFPSSEDEPLEIAFEGEPTVTPAGDHYDVALPPLTISGEETSLDVGVIRLTLVPKGDGTYAVEATLPSRMELTSDEDEPAALLTIGTQRFKGVWSAAMENFLSADMAYGNIALTPPKGEGFLRIGSLTGTQDLHPDGPTTWGGPLAGAISDVSLVDTQKGNLLTIGGITTEATYSRIDLAKATRVKTLVAEHTAAGTQPKATQILPLLGGIVGEASMRTRITGLSAGDQNGRLAFDLASVQFGVTDIDRDNATVSFGFQSEGLKIEPLPGPQQFMPQRFDVQVSLAKLPNAALGQAMLAMATLEEQQKPKAPPKKGAKNSDANDEARDQLMAVTGAMLMEAATQAGTELRLETLTLDTPAVSGSVTGAAQMLSKAAMGAAGSADIVLRGLDAAAKALSPAPGSKPDAEAQQALGVIAMLQAMGQQGKDEKGGDVRTYKVDLTPEGQILLNGADMNAMMNMGGGQPAEPAPKKGHKKN